MATNDTVRQRQRINRDRLEPVTNDTAPTALISAAVAPSGAQALSPFMMCSMPPLAATFDQFSRQFYGRSVFPQQRILPPSIE
jgi:hypothetical protein